jgi:dTDP-4-amino-4,6-dideoxygalactose transaminase
MSSLTNRSQRSTFLQYCLPSIGEEEIAEVVDTLRAGWLTTGPKVKQFEENFANYVGARHAIAVNSCTAALHVSLRALDIGPDDEVIVPTMTFCSSANVVVHLGAKPILVDINENFHISTEAIEKAITSRTRAIMPVHYAGQACDMDEIRALADGAGIPIVEDAAHAAGAEYRGRKIGTHGRAVAFSFYATKNMTTGEGGMITTNDDQLAERMRPLVLHGMNRDAWKRYTEFGSWYYEIAEPGYKYNMTDIQAALGIHQLSRLDTFNRRRQEIARQYQQAFAEIPELRLPRLLPDRNHIFYHYPLQIVENRLKIDRAQFIQELNAAKIGASVHFIPVHRHPYYEKEYNYQSRDFPVAERIYSGLLSIPLYPKMSDKDVADVIGTVQDIVTGHRI